MIKDFDRELVNVRTKASQAGLKSSLEESVQKRLHHLEIHSANLQEKSHQTFTQMTNMKHECEQLTSDIKQIYDWLKATDQQLNRFLLENLNTADEKNDAVKKLLVREEFFPREYVLIDLNL